MSGCQIRIMERWGTLFEPRGPPFYGVFGPKLPYLALGSPSHPKWVEHWLNMVLHCTSHLGGEFGPLLPPKNGIICGPQNPPKMTFFGQKLPYLAVPATPNGLNTGWTSYFTFGGSVILFGTPSTQKQPFLGGSGATECHFLGAKRVQIDPPRCEVQCSTKVQPIWGRWDCLWPNMAIFGQKR